MRTPVFTGNCPALVTPFDANGSINYDAFGRLIDAQIEAGVDAVCVCGTTGESATMSIREHNAAVEYCVKRVNKRVPAHSEGEDAQLMDIINYSIFGLIKARGIKF